MSRLAVSEFNRTYDSFKRVPNKQLQHELAEELERAKDAPQTIQEPLEKDFQTSSPGFMIKRNMES
ncbi:hypothetical protein N7451_010941 [Penicillium sp. IBT 35674x]|nr:hypothetical protein N7451_010941 [Penicillium sp. IBT 35674x]